MANLMRKMFTSEQIKQFAKEEIDKSLYCFEIETEQDQDGRNVVKPFDKFDELYDLLENGTQKPIYIWCYDSTSDVYIGMFLTYNDDWMYNSMIVYFEIVGGQKVIYFE